MTQDKKQDLPIFAKLFETQEQKTKEKTSDFKLISKSDQPDSDQKSLDLTLENSPNMENFSTIPTKFSNMEEISTLEKFSNQESTEVKITLEKNSNLKSFLRLPHWVLDQMYKHLDNNEQLLYLHLFRLSHGYDKHYCVVSLEKLALRVGMTHRTVQKTIITLEAKGMIKKMGYKLSNTKEKGTEYWVENFSKIENFSNMEKFSNNKYPKEKLKEIYTKLVRQFREIYPEKKGIGEIAEEVKIACSNKGIPFDPKTFNELDNKIWI